MALLEIEDLHVEFPSQGAVLHAVDGVSLSLDEGEVLGIVGESGSGKSVTMLALMGLVAVSRAACAPSACASPATTCCASRTRERRKLVGKDVAMIFQEPTTSLNPCFTIGFQITETLRLHLGLERRAARDRATELLEQVGIPAAASRLGDYPHQLSGGMNQRVMIAMAIACNPRLLIADEPTTALDVTIQAQILDLLRGLQAERGMALVLVTHNMGVVSEMAHRVAVMYAGQVVEERGADALFADAAASLHRGAAGGDARAQHRRDAAGHDPGRRARVCTTGRTAACSRRAARTPPTRACQARPAMRPWQGGLVRCHFPLGDPQREAAIAADRACRARCTSERATRRRRAVVEARELTRIYEIRRGPMREPARLQAVGGVSFAIRRRPHAGGGRRIRAAASRRWRGWCR